MPRHTTGTTIREDHPNRAIARELWRAAADGDVDGIRRLLAPDLSFHSHGSGDLSGHVCGPDALLDLLARSGEMVDSLTSQLIDIFSSDSGAVLYYRTHAERGPRALDTDELLVLRVEGGLVVEAFTTPVDPDPGFWHSH